MRAMARHGSRARATIIALLALPLGWLHATAPAQEAPRLSPFSQASGTQPPAPWRVVGLPRGKAPLTDLQVLEVDGRRALRLRSQASYGNLVHPVTGYTPAASATLAWRWRLDEPVAGADLRQRSGDDSALKLCLMFDLPLERLGLWERTLMRAARAASQEALPAATLCYVWDPSLAPGTLLPNAYSARVRFLVLDGAGATPGQWREHRRAIVTDFMRAFGDEAREPPPLIAVAAGADSDNTGGASTAWLDDVSLLP